MAQFNRPTSPIFLPRLRPRGGTFASAYRQARAANEARYRDINRRFDIRERDVMAEFSKLGAAGEAAYGESQRSNLATLRQESVTSGMPLASILTSGRAARRRRETDVTRLQGLERIATLRAQSIASLRGDRLAFMERRTDAYPDPRLFAQLYGQQGYGEGAQGIAGGGSGLIQRRRSTWPSDRRAGGFAPSGPGEPDYEGGTYKPKMRGPRYRRRR